MNRLAKAGVLVQRNVDKQRYRIFEAPEVLDLFTSLERALRTLWRLHDDDDQS